MSKMNRRTILTAIAAAPAVGLPAMADAAQVDPIFAVIEAHRIALLEMRNATWDMNRAEEEFADQHSEEWDAYRAWLETHDFRDLGGRFGRSRFLGRFGFAPAFRNHVVTVKDYAKADFEAWPENSSGKLFPSIDLATDLGNWARVANAIMQRSRAELIRGVDEMSDDAFVATNDGLYDAADCLKAISGMVDAAHTRLLAPAAAALYRKDKARKYERG